MNRARSNMDKIASQAGARILRFGVVHMACKEHMGMSPNPSVYISLLCNPISFHRVVRQDQHERIISRAGETTLQLLLANPQLPAVVVTTRQECSIQSDEANRQVRTGHRCHPMNIFAYRGEPGREIKVLLLTQ